MSKLVGQELTRDLLSRLNGSRIEEMGGKVIVIATVDESGWAHPAMLSYYEIAAKDATRIDVAIGKNSTTEKNLKRTGALTLIVTDNEVNFYLKGKAVQIKETLDGVSFMSLFRLTLGTVLEDQESGATITSGVTFVRPEKKEVSELMEKVFAAVTKEPLRG